MHLVDYLSDGTTEIPFTAFLPNQTQKWFILFHLSNFLNLQYNTIRSRNVSRAKKEKNNNTFLEVFKYRECSTTCCQTTEPTSAMFSLSERAHPSHASHSCYTAQDGLYSGGSSHLFTSPPKLPHPFYVKSHQEYFFLPWLVWLSGLSASLWTKGSLVQFPVRAHAWVAGQVPSRGCVRGNHTLIISFPLSPSHPLNKNKINKKILKRVLFPETHF